LLLVGLQLLISWLSKTNAIKQGYRIVFSGAKVHAFAEKEKGC